MRRHTFWNWASCSTRLDNGTSFGFNLAAGVNETSYTENCLWFGHQQILLPPIQFHFNREQPLQPWTVTSGDGRFEAQFQPKGIRKEHVEAILLASKFKQVFGTFSGHFRDQLGQQHNFGPSW